MKLLSAEARNSTALGDLLRAADPADRNHVGQVLPEARGALAREPREALRVGGSGAERIDPDSAVPQLHGQRAGQRPHGSLARVVDTVSRGAVAQAIDDTRTIVAPSFSSGSARWTVK